MKYDDIINLPHHVSSVHKPMPMIKRAAQFAPFSALTGYEDVIEESARLTDDRIEPDEGVLEELDRRIREAAAAKAEVTVTYFAPDSKKAGGKYVEATGRIKRIGTGMIVLDSGDRIPAEDVTDIRQF